MLEKITVLELHLDAPPFGTSDDGSERTQSERRAAEGRSSAPGRGTGSAEPDIEEVGTGDRAVGERTDTRTAGKRTSPSDDVAIDLEDDSESRNWRLVALVVASLVVSALVALLAYRLVGSDEADDDVEHDDPVTVGADR